MDCRRLQGRLGAVLVDHEPEVVDRVLERTLGGDVAVLGVFMPLEKEKMVGEIDQVIECVSAKLLLRT